MALDYPDSVRGEFFCGLSRTLSAGMPADRALKVLADFDHRNLDAAIMRMAALVRAGQTLAEAGKLAGVLAPVDVELVRAAEQSGSMVDTAARLAAHYTDRWSRGRRLRANLAMPALVLVIGVFILPVPALVAGRLAPADYVNVTVLPLLLLLAGLRLLAWYWRRRRSHGLSRLAGRVIALLPVIGALAARLARLEVLEALEMYLRAGVPAREAVSGALRRVTNRHHRAAFRAASTALARGAGLAEALRVGQVLDSGDDYAVLAAAEEAGRMEEALARRLAHHRQLMTESSNMLGDWIPRIVYGLVLVVLAAGYLG